MNYKCFKTEIDPNNEQITLLVKHAGVARFTYNWALGLLKEDWDSGRKELKPNAYFLQRYLNTKKYIEFPWMSECSKWCMQNALRNVENAYRKFFNKQCRFPKFKKKGRKDSFTVNEPIHITNNMIQLPKIGKIRLKEKGYIPEGDSKSVTVSQKAGRWFVSVRCEVEIPKSSFTNEKIGGDLGIKTFLTLSDGTVFDKNTEFKENELKLKRLQRKLSRQKPESKGRNKTKQKVAKLYLHISNCRKDLLQKTTSFLVKTKSEGTVVIEDLNIKGMSKNHCLARAILNIGRFEFKQLLKYKCRWYGKKLILADRFYPSSKTCSCCGNIKKELSLSERVYKCEKCGFEMDRDLNAAINLSLYIPKNNVEEIKNTVRYTEIQAGVSEKKLKRDKKFIKSKDLRCLSVKPEENIESKQL